MRPFIYDLVEDESAGEWERSYVENTKRKHPLYLFASGPSYIWGIFTSDIHLFGTESEAPFFFLGPMISAEISLPVFVTVLEYP